MPTILVDGVGHDMGDLVQDRIVHVLFVLGTPHKEERRNLDRIQVELGLSCPCPASRVDDKASVREDRILRHQTVPVRLKLAVDVVLIHG